MKDVFRGFSSDIIKKYTTSERLEITKMLDSLGGEWPECIDPENLFCPQDLSHLEYYTEHHPDTIDVTSFIREDPTNEKANEILVRLAIKQMDDHSNPSLQEILISEFMDEELNVPALSSAAVAANEKWKESFEKIKAQKAEKKRKEEDDSPDRILDEDVDRRKCMASKEHGATVHLLTRLCG